MVFIVYCAYPLQILLKYLYIFAQYLVPIIVINTMLFINRNKANEQKETMQKKVNHFSRGSHTHRKHI